MPVGRALAWLAWIVLAVTACAGPAPTDTKPAVGSAAAATPRSTSDCSAPAAPGVNWSNCSLHDLDLTRADLTRADLSGADLTRTDLTGADLTGADLTDTILSGGVQARAKLTDADLTGAELFGAVLTDAILTGAKLTDAELTRADLTRADMTGATGVPRGSFSTTTWLGATCPDGTKAGLSCDGHFLP